MGSVRNDIAQLIREKLYIEVPDHSVFTNPDKFKGFIKILDGDIDTLVDIIIKRIKEVE